jgi:O-methyltransferase involved in polyketide biosynthesis
VVIRPALTAAAADLLEADGLYRFKTRCGPPALLHRNRNNSPLRRDMGPPALAARLSEQPVSWDGRVAYATPPHLAVTVRAIEAGISPRAARHLTERHSYTRTDATDCRQNAPQRCLRRTVQVILPGMGTRRQGDGTADTSSADGDVLPTPAGMYDYVLGGAHHTAADREAAEMAIAATPEMRDGIVGNRKFMQRAVRFVARQGVRQFIDLGSGYPTAGPVHEIAAETVSPRVLYVDYDPAVVELSRRLIKAPAVTAAAYDIREPERIIASPEMSGLIDWSVPVAVLMVAVLHFITNEENPARIVAAFRQRMAPGSYLVLSHGCFGDNPDGARRAAGSWNRATSQMMLRTRDEIAAFFTGLELASPGLVSVQEWVTGTPSPRGQAMVLAGVARVP